MVARPFIDNGRFRTFGAYINSFELKWHWDEEDRFVTPTHDTNWKFQYDNALPQSMLQGVSFYIAAGTWHRLIKGFGSLTLEVIKHDSRKFDSNIAV